MAIASLKKEDTHLFTFKVIFILFFQRYKITIEKCMQMYKTKVKFIFPFFGEKLPKIS